MEPHELISFHFLESRKFGIFFGQELQQSLLSGSLTSDANIFCPLKLSYLKEILLIVQGIRC